MPETQEALRNAILSLVMIDCGVHERLAAAAPHLLKLNVTDLPSGMREKFESIQLELVADSAHRLSPQQEAKLAERILHMYTAYVTRSSILLS